MIKDKISAMLTRKKLLTVALPGLIALLACYAGLSYWMGIQAEKTLQEQHKFFTDHFLFKVKSHSYQRGWFSSIESTELVFNRDLLGPYENLLPEQLRHLLGKSIRYTNHISHGPLPGLKRFDLIPAKAYVKTEFFYADETKKKLYNFFGDQPPLTLTNRIYFTGGGYMHMNIPAFDYEEAFSGIKINWKGWDLALRYKESFKEYQVTNTIPGLAMSAKDKGGMDVSGILYVADTRTGPSGLSIGSNRLTVENASLSWSEGIPYDIKLNELLYLITHIRLGEFINPSGEFELSNIQLHKLHYNMTSNEEKGFLNAEGKAGFDKLIINQSEYGPMILDVTANHWHAQSLKQLGEELSAMSKTTNPEEAKQLYIDTIMKHGTTLLTNNPKITLNSFQLTGPSGQIKLDGEIELLNLQAEDIQDTAAILQHVNAKANISIPKKTLEGFFIAQMRNLFMVDPSAEDKPNEEEIDETAIGMLDNMLQTWESEGYVIQKQGQVISSTALKNGELTVQSKRVELPWENL